MDCVKFMNVVCVLAIPFFISLYFIVEFQPEFYKYPKTDPKKLKEAILVALILHFILSILLTIWHNRRYQAKKRLKIYESDPHRFQGNVIKGNIQQHSSSSQNLLD